MNACPLPLLSALPNLAGAVVPGAATEEGQGDQGFSALLLALLGLPAPTAPATAPEEAGVDTPGPEAKQPGEQEELPDQILGTDLSPLLVALAADEPTTPVFAVPQAADPEPAVVVADAPAPGPREPLAGVCGQQSAPAFTGEAPVAPAPAQPAMGPIVEAAPPAKAPAPAASPATSAAAPPAAQLASEGAQPASQPAAIFTEAMEGQQRQPADPDARPASDAPQVAAAMQSAQRPSETVSPPAWEAMTAVPAAEANSPSTGARTVAAPEPEPSASLPAATAAAPSPTNAELPVQGTSPAPEATGPVSLEGFAERIVTHVRMSAGEGSGHVDIQLHPQHLGRVSVSLSVHGNEVTLNLTTDNPAAQHLLSARLPELTLALAQAGMALSQANVSLSDQGKERHSYPERDSSGRVRDEARPVEAVLASWQPSSLHALDLSA